MKQSARLFVHNLWGAVQDETWDPLLENSKNFNCRASDWAPSKSRALCNWAGHVKLAVPLASRKQSSWDLNQCYVGCWHHRPGLRLLPHSSNPLLFM